MKTFAERLRYVRQLRNLSQKTLARASGVSQSAISSYENGTRLSPKNLILLAQALEVSPYWLSRGEGTMAPEPLLASTMGDIQWPFRLITPQQYWGLRFEHREVIEQTILTMITGFQIPPTSK